MSKSGQWQLKVRLGQLKGQVMALAKGRRLTVSRLVESLVRSELGVADAVADEGAEPVPDMHAAWETAILPARRARTGDSSRMAAPGY